MNESFDVIKKNFEFCKDRNNDLRNVTRGVINSVAAVIKQSYPSLPEPEEAFEIYSSYTTPSAEEFYLLCLELWEMYQVGNYRNGFEKNSGFTGEVSYVSGQVFERAVGRIPGGKNLTPVCVSDFKTACEDVYYDRSSYCLLPLENNTDGLLLTFRRLAEKYELRISTAIKTHVGDDSMTLALMSSEGNIGGIYHEVSIPDSAALKTSEFLNAVEAFGGEIKRINYIPSSLGEGNDVHISVKYTGDLGLAGYFFRGAYPAYHYYGSYTV